MNTPALIISLDLEQHWGVYDHSTSAEYGARLDGARRAVPLILERFQRTGIAATWATVGLLMCENAAEARRLLPTLPRYPALRFQLDDVLASAGQSEKDDPRHFSKSLVRRIHDTARQEIATHTFSHFYCLEEGPTLEHFEADLRAAQAVASEIGITLRSIVFPRNQYSDTHLEVCSRLGFKAFRGNPSVEPYIPRNQAETKKRRRLQRLVDAFIPVVPTKSLLCRPLLEKGLVNVPASRFLRPIGRTDRLLTPLRVRRITTEMTAAAREGACYHLWWHPHNFGLETDLHLELLDQILEHFVRLRDRFGMQSLSMADAAARVA